MALLKILSLYGIEWATYLGALYYAWDWATKVRSWLDDASLQWEEVSQ